MHNFTTFGGKCEKNKNVLKQIPIQNFCKVFVLSMWEMCKYIINQVHLGVLCNTVFYDYGAMCAQDDAICFMLLQSFSMGCFFFIFHWMFKNEGLRHLGWVACKWQACFLLQRLVLDFFWGGNMGTIMKIDDVYDSAFYVTSLIYTQLIINKCKSIKGSMVVPWCPFVVA